MKMEKITQEEICNLGEYVLQKTFESLIIKDITLDDIFISRSFIEFNKKLNNETTKNK